MRMILGSIVMVAATAVPAMAEETPDWSLSLSGGISSVESQSDQQIGAIGLTRNFGDTYVRASITRIDGGDSGVAGALPANTTQFTVAGGTSFGNLGIDAYVLAGPRKFDTASFNRRNGTTITLDTSGSIYGAGATVTYDIPLGRYWFASPFAGIDYNRIDTARVLNPQSATPIVRNQRQQGATGSAGATVSYLFGKDAASSMGVYAAGLTTSNAAAVNRAGSTVRGSQLLSAIDGTGGSDSWGEYGGQVSFAVGGGFRIDASLIRTAGLSGGESTSGSIGLRFGF